MGNILKNWREVKNGMNLSQKFLDKIKNSKKLAREQSCEKHKIEMYLKDAINRESLKKNKIKEYE